VIGNPETRVCAVHTRATGRVSGIATTGHLSIFLESRSFFTHRRRYLWILQSGVSFVKGKRCERFLFDKIGFLYAYFRHTLGRRP
jgi:hypothetical protein